MQKSRIIVVLDNTGQNKTLCWLGDDKFAEDIKGFDATNADDVDLIALDSVISHYFQKDELTEDHDLIGKNWDGEDNNDTVIQEITYVHEIN
tara:strand:- start:34 stop:309 length:276 start_codon:yes stop_codon:yes gene_type:complete